MEELIKRVSFNKSGSGGITPKLNLKNQWLIDMNVTETEKEVVLRYDNEKKEIIISKSKSKSK